MTNINWLKEKVAALNSYMHSSTVVNIMNSGLKVNDNQWLKYFLETYNEKIGFKNENREEIIKFCWAQYFFSEKKYDKAEENTNVYYENIFYFIATRRMRIKIYFEKKEYLALESELESFKVYLYRQYKQKQEISEGFFQPNNAFVDALKQIYHLFYTPSAAKKKKLMEKIQNGKYSEQDWLIEKLQAIKV